jgi:glycolate oxidase FAD binding subunit
MHQIPVDADDDITIDGTRAGLRVEPSSIPEVQHCLREANAAGARLVAVGSGSRLQFGNVSDGVDAIASFAALNRVVALEPADMTVTVEAGVGIDKLQMALHEHGQFLPLDAPGVLGTVGGLLSSNASGPLRHRYGTVRDWVLGTRVVHADGSTSKSGGRVVKNVSGYDMHKLYVGSLGTLGFIVETTLKVTPLPRVDETVAVACPSAVAAVSIAIACHERGLGLIAAELLSPTAASELLGIGSWCALLRIGCGAASAARTLREIDEYTALADGERTDTSIDVWERWRSVFALGMLSLRVSVPPSRVADTAESLDRRFAGEAAMLSATVSVGLLRVDLKPASGARASAIIGEATEIARRRGGFVFVDAAPVESKREIDVFGAERADIEIMRRLKQEFDPKRILAPGRFAGRI